jgi:hypothetical protein
MSEEDKKKKDEEKQKKSEEEALESQTVAKRRAIKIFIHGQNYFRSEVTQLINPLLTFCVFLETSSKIHIHRGNNSY